MIRFFYIFILFTLFSCSAFSLNNIKAIKSVAGRVAPWLADRLLVKSISSVNGYDVFEIRTFNNNLEISASSVPAAGMALNYYLKYYCNCHYSTRGKNMKSFSVLPEITMPVRKVCKVENRHFLNLCTQSYSASFWAWDEWEQLLDYIVLNGVNMAFATVGVEQVWYNVLKQFNYSEEEIFDFLPGPAFNAWHMMGNHEGWGGPLTKNIVDNRSKLGKRIINRMRELEIEPIFISFYGMVPTTLQKKYPDAKIIDQGMWAGAFHRPSILLAGQPLFDKMADAYYKEVINLYGNFKYWAGEPFHEGGKRGEINVSKLAASILKKMRDFSSDAVWILQGWNRNPSKDFLSSMSKNGDVLIVDMKGEGSNEWEKSMGYYGYPYLWGVVEDFGGKPGLHGNLERYATEPFRAMNSVYGANMKGIAVSPESLFNNPVDWDFLFEVVWHSKPVDVSAWVEQYSVYRYGLVDDNMKEVWKILLNTAYSNKVDSIFISPESKILPPVGGGSTVICAPPALDLKRTSSWDNSLISYDFRALKKIIPYILKSIDKFKNIDAFRYDAVDFTRQIIANEFRDTYYRFNYAVKQNDLVTVESCANLMIEQLKDMDRVLSLHSGFMLGTWLNSAISQASDDKEVILFEKNARALITYWGPDKSDTNLRDYAHKEWSGLVSDVYLPRWIDFFNYQINRLKGVDGKMMDYVGFEIEWSNANNKYPDKPISDFEGTLTNILLKYK